MDTFFLNIIVLGKEIWLWSPAKFFVICFCWQFWELTVHKSWQNTIGDYFCHDSYSIFPLSRNWPGMQLFLNCFLACLFAFFNCLLNIKRVYNEPCLLSCVCRRIRGLLQLPTGHVSLYWTFWLVEFSHITAAILVSQNRKTAAKLVSLINPLEIELYFYRNIIFCSSNLIYGSLSREKTLNTQLKWTSKKYDL